MSSIDPSAVESIRLTCRALFAPGQVAELRVLGLAGRERNNAAGWFNDYEALAQTALNLEQKSPEGIYVTINPLLDGCLARCSNRCKENTSRTSSDRDVARRYWLPIDIDPTGSRPSGVSSTDEELNYALESASAIVDFLEVNLKFPYGVRAHSGNGLHLLYRIDLPNDEDSRDLIKTCLGALHDRFSNENVKIDTTLFNAARIMKLYGTVARKGENTPSRPHRRSRLWRTKDLHDYPTFARLPIADKSLLEKLADTGRQGLSSAASKSKRKKSPDTPASGTLSPGGNNGSPSPKKRVSESEYFFDLDTWIVENEIGVVRKETWDGTGTRYILEQCLFNESHTNTSACIGRSREGRIFYRCQHDSCVDRRWEDARRIYRERARHADEMSRQFKRPGESGDSAADPWQLAGAMIDEKYSDSDTGHVLLRRHRETYYVYSRRTKCYRPITNGDMRDEITRWLGGQIEEVTIRKTNDVMNSLGARISLPADLEMPFMSTVDKVAGRADGDPQARNWITLKNGILDVDRVIAGEPVRECVMAHTPAWFNEIALPFNFPMTDEQSKHPRWDEFLNDIFEDDEERIAVLQEAFGYCFFNDTSLERFFILYGHGRNGKSTALAILRKLLGEQNVSSLTPDQLADQTAVFGIYGKMANVCADLKEISGMEEGVIKKIVSGEEITANRKYKDFIQFKPATKLFFGTNPLPRFTDTSIGIWRRMFAVPFNRVVPTDRVDVHLFNKLENELPGIFLWALEGMIRLKQTMTFTPSAKCAKASRDYRLHCFPILMFLEECTESTGCCIARDLWLGYRKWADAVGLKKHKPLHPFLRDVLGFLPHVRYTKPHTRMESAMELEGVSIRFGADLEYSPSPHFNTHGVAGQEEET